MPRIWRHHILYSAGTSRFLAARWRGLRQKLSPMSTIAPRPNGMDIDRTWPIWVAEWSVGCLDSYVGFRGQQSAIRCCIDSIS